MTSEKTLEIESMVDDSIVMLKEFIAAGDGKEPDSIQVVIKPGDSINYLNKHNWHAFFAVEYLGQAVFYTDFIGEGNTIYEAVVSLVEAIRYNFNEISRTKEELTKLNEEKNQTNAKIAEFDSQIKELNEYNNDILGVLKAGI